MLRLQNICIQSTMDYEKFTAMVGNRAIMDANVKKLVVSMGKGQLASIGIVNKKGEIIDGQHRYKACKELGIPFYYIIMPNYGIEEVHTLNSNMKNWTNRDYVHQYADRYMNGEKLFIHYFRLQAFMEMHSLHLNDGLLLLEGGIKSGTQTLRNGTFKITESTESAEERLGELMELEKILGSKTCSQTFWQTYILSRRVEGFDPDRFFNKIKAAKGAIDEAKDTFNSYISIFEEAYNKGKNKDLNLAYPAKQLDKQLRRNRSEDVTYED
ncbi:MAG: ParB N-terminal domain-containing protein [Caldisericia bacterium]|nr:ParB N-terminal domain-containing protein [Caldisericia bacterium]